MQVSDEHLTQTVAPACGVHGGRHGSQHSVGVPGLGQHRAAYRFFSNDWVNNEEILAGHFTRSRFAATTGPILVLQDTTETAF